MKITADIMASEVTPHTARWSPDAAADGAGAWVVSWLPLRLLTEDQVLTAMIMAESVARGDAVPGNQVWLHFQKWARELGLSADDALVAIKRERLTRYAE